MKLDYPANDKRKIIKYPLIRYEKSVKIRGFFMQRNIEENAEDINGLCEIKAFAGSIKNISESAFLLYKPIVEDNSLSKNTCKR